MLEQAAEVVQLAVLHLTPESDVGRSFLARLQRLALPGKIERITIAVLFLHQGHALLCNSSRARRSLRPH